MIKVYGMPSCPDCAEVEERIKASGKENDFTLVDIGKHVVYLKAFLQLRDRDVISGGKRAGLRGNSLLCPRGWQRNALI